MGRDRQQRQNGDHQSNHKAPAFGSGCPAVSVPIKPAISRYENAHAAHNRQVDDDRPECPFFDIAHPLLGQGVFALKLLVRTFTLPPSSLRDLPLRRPDCNPPTCGRTAPLAATSSRMRALLRRCVPSSSTMILSAPTTVDRRWAIMMTVRLLVSSRQRPSGSAPRFQDRQRRWPHPAPRLARPSGLPSPARCAGASPPDKIGPSVPILVSTPAGSFCKNVPALRGHQRRQHLFPGGARAGRRGRFPESKSSKQAAVLENECYLLHEHMRVHLPHVHTANFHHAGIDDPRIGGSGWRPWSCLRPRGQPARPPAPASAQKETWESAGVCAPS